MTTPTPELVTAEQAAAWVSEDPRHCAISLAATVEALWKARAKLAALGAGDE